MGGLAFEERALLNHMLSIFRKDWEPMSAYGWPELWEEMWQRNANTLERVRCLMVCYDLIVSVLDVAPGTNPAVILSLDAVDHYARRSRDIELSSADLDIELFELSSADSESSTPDSFLS
jgi:hypothetical protein